MPTREVIYRCTGPNCTTFIQSTSTAPPRGWLLVRERDGENPTELDFCGWQCVLCFASRIDPEEVIEAAL